MLDYRKLISDIQAEPGRYRLANYAYTLIGDGLANTAQIIFNLPIDASAPFVWCKTAYWASIASAAQTDSARVIPLATLQITDTGSAQPFFDVPQFIPTIAGHEGLPQILEAPYVFGASSSINSVFTGVVAATTYSALRVSLIGYRVYQYN
jgi:hypothetical protein